MVTFQNNLKELPQADVIPPSLELDSATFVRGDIFIMKEIWEDIVSERFKGLYKVSSKRRIKSTRRGNVLTQRISDTGYLVVSCRDHNNKASCFQVHREYAKCFIPNPLNLPEVNHEDGNKLNNGDDNLVWCDKLYNMRHAFRTGLIKSAKGEKAGSAKRHEKEILEIFHSKERIVDIAEKYKIDRTLIWAIKVGKQWGSVTGMPKYKKQFFL